MGNNIAESDGLIEVVSVLGRNIRITQKYWDHIVQHKHPELHDLFNKTLSSLYDSDEVYQQEEAVTSIYTIVIITITRSAWSHGI